MMQALPGSFLHHLQFSALILSPEDGNYSASNQQVPGVLYSTFSQAPHLCLYHIGQNFVLRICIDFTEAGKRSL